MGRPRYPDRFSRQNRGSFRLLRSFHSPELNLFVTLPSTPTYLTTAWLKHEIKSHFDLSGLLFIKEADQNHFLQKARPIARIFIHSFFAKRSRCDSHHRHCPSSGRRHLNSNGRQRRLRLWTLQTTLGVCHLPLCDRLHLRCRRHDVVPPTPEEEVRGTSSTLDARGPSYSTCGKAITHKQKQRR